MNNTLDSSLPANSKTPGNGLLRVLGALLSLASAILAILGLIFQHNILSLIFSGFIVLFAVRVFILWLGSNRATVTHGIPPAYAFYSSYSQGQSAPHEESQRTLTSGPYGPLEQDPLFALDAPSGNERCFMLAKKAEPLVECQDRYAIHGANRCYAVADGVAGSFVPGPWARIVTKGFVERGGKFANKEDFQGWLLACSREWQYWIETRWIPTINALRERNGERPGDWNDDLRQGAQTTLIGCSLFSNTEQHDAPTSATVFAVGDSEFFLFSPNPNGGYDVAETFPFSDPNEFNVRSDALVTVQRTDLLERAWVQRKTMHINVFSGDLIVLASNSLAKWLLTQVYQQSNKWLPLLTCRSAAEFERYMRGELQQGLIEDDDLTMLVIPIL